MGLFDAIKGRFGGGKTAEERRMEKLRSMMPTPETESGNADPVSPLGTDKPEETVSQSFDEERFAMPRLSLEQLGALRSEPEPSSEPIPAYATKEPERPPETDAAAALRLLFPVEDELPASPEPSVALAPEPAVQQDPESAPEPEPAADETVKVRFFGFGAPPEIENEAEEKGEGKTREKKTGRFGFLFRKSAPGKQTVEEPPAPEIPAEVAIPKDVPEDSADMRTEMERLADQIQSRYPQGIRSLYALQDDLQFRVEIPRVMRNQKDREELKKLLRERKLILTEQINEEEADGVTEVTSELFEQFMNRLTADNQGMLFSYAQVADSAFFRNTLPLYEDFCRNRYNMPLEDYLITRRKLAAGRDKLSQLGLLPDFVLRAPADTVLEDYAHANGLPFEAEDSAEGTHRRLHRIVRVKETEKGNNCFACLKLRLFEPVTLLREPEGRVAVYNRDNELCGYVDEAEQRWISTAMEQDKIAMQEPLVVEHGFISDAGKFRRKTQLVLYFNVTFDSRRFVLYGKTPFDEPQYFAAAPKEGQRSPEGYPVMNLDNSPEAVTLNTRRVEGVSLRSCDDLSDWDYTLRPDGTVALKGYRGTESKLTLPSVIDGYPVTEVVRDGFSGCGGLTGVRIPSSIRLIGENAFRSCAQLQSVTIGEGCESMGRNAFADCPALTRVVSPASLCELADATPFSHTPWRDETTEEYLLLGGVLLSWQGRKLTMRIPGGVLVYGRNAAAANPDLREVVFPDGMFAIREQAFYPGNKKLEKITVPMSVRSIGENAFRGTKWLAGHTDELLTVNDLLLRYRGADKTVHLGEEIHIICDGAFQGCAIERVWFEDTLTDIGANSFRRCENLRDVSAGNGLRRIGDNAFAQCRNLKGFFLSDKIESVGERAFWGCTALEELQYPHRIIRQGKDAFVGTAHIAKYEGFAVSAGCLIKYLGNAASLSIPEGVVEIAPRSFAGLRNLVSVSLPSSLQRIGCEAFSDCVCLYEVTGAGSVAEIGAGAFRNCRSLRRYPFHAALRVIGEQAFADTDLEKWDLPRELSWLGAGAFSGKTELTVYDKIGMKASGGKCSLSAALLATRGGIPLYDSDTTIFAPIRITVKSALSGSVKYSFYFDGRGESRAYQDYLLTCWGRGAEMSWAEFDRVFMKIRNPVTRLRCAYDRLKSTPSPDDERKEFYRRYLTRVLCIPESFDCVAGYLTENDDKNLLALLLKLGAVTDGQRAELRRLTVERGAVKCEKVLTKA